MYIHFCKKQSSTRFIFSPKNLFHHVNVFGELLIITRVFVNRLIYLLCLVCDINKYCRTVRNNNV